MDSVLHVGGEVCLHEGMSDEVYQIYDDHLPFLFDDNTTVKHDFSGQTTIFGGIYGTGKIFIGQMRVDSFYGQ
jgi:hypothetical protein